MRNASFAKGLIILLVSGNACLTASFADNVAPKVAATTANDTKSSAESQAGYSSIGTRFQRLRRLIHRRNRAEAAPSAAAVTKSVDQAVIADVATTSDGKGVDPVNTLLVKPPTVDDAKTAVAVGDVTGQRLAPAQMAQPVIDDTPIEGFHPIKKLMQPIVNLEKNSVLLEQQIMRMEGPIASLQGPMIGLQEKMVGVKGEMVDMRHKLTGMQGTVIGMQKTVVGVGGDMHDIGKQMTNVRGDLTRMQNHIVLLEDPIRDLLRPIRSLQQPIEAIAVPVVGVQKQLGSVQQELADLKTLLGTILAAIFVAAGAIAFGTPAAAFVIYKNRHKLFPGTRERDFPVVNKPAEKLNT